MKRITVYVGNFLPSKKDHEFFGEYPELLNNIPQMPVEVSKRADEVIKYGHEDIAILTTSEIFCLRLRRRIAEGAQFLLTFVFADGKIGKVDSDGEVDYWPRGLFSEDFADFRAIRAAQRLTRKNKQ